VTAIEFLVTFHARFRVGTTYARDGVDAALDRGDPLPGDHLKGVMRSAAVEILGEGPVGAVFGTPRTPSPWAWTGAVPEPTSDGTPSWQFSRRHRVAIDGDTHSARKDFLVQGEAAFAETAYFTVELVGALDPADEPWHTSLLRVSAASVHGLGAWRRRGLGWVGIAPTDMPVALTELTDLLTRRKVPA
jgi:hypothetical protein